MSNLISTYDNDWTTTITNSNASLSELQNTKGCFLGNGKIGFISAIDKIGVQKSIITTNFELNENGSYTNNIIDGFNHATIKLFDNKIEPETVASCHFNSQSLNMFNGIATTSLTYTNIASSNTVSVSYDVYPVRHLPYCSMQTITLTPNFSSGSNLNLEFYHEISCGTNITVDDYNNNVIYNELVNPIAGMYMLNGKGRIVDTGNSIAIASCYLFEQVSNFKLVGFNRYRQNLNTCFQKIVLDNFTSGQSFKMHIFSTQMSDCDFKLPAEETKRISVNVLNKMQTVDQITLLRQNHVSAWYNMWKSNISIDQKLGITTDEADKFNLVKRTIRYSMYNIWASVREGIRTEVNPSSLTVIDNVGNLFWDGDLWFIPVLIMFRPDIAKNILEARYRVIDKAIQLATGYGYQGSKFPYINDVSGYINSPYWDLNGPLHIFNTALISINVWNYYRVTQDKDWMTNKGYTILKNNANFFISKITIDEAGVYHIEDVYSFHDKVSTNNALTNYMIKVALKYALEASYELNIIPRDEWSQAYYNIDFVSFENNTAPAGTVATTSGSAIVTGTATKFTTSLNIGENMTINGNSYTILSIQSDTLLTLTTNALETISGALYTSTTVSPDYPNIIRNDTTTAKADKYKFLEMLIPVLTYYNETYYKANTNRGLDTIKSNLDFYKTRLQTAYQSNPMNNMILTWLDGILLNHPSTPTSGVFDYPDLMNTDILKIISENSKGVWGNFNMDNKDSAFNDISLSSMYILMLLTTVGTLKITGSVSETHFYNDSMGMRAYNTSNMPKTWKNVKLTGVGLGNETYNVLNNIYYS
jgi:trehalose/maltose hydrolase-like predicted phosphorylase